METVEYLKNCSLCFMLQTTCLQSPGATDDRYVKVVSMKVVKVCRTLEVQIYPFLTSVPDRVELLVSGCSHFPPPQDNSPHCAQNSGLGGLQTRSGALEKWSVLPPPRIEPRFLDLPANSVLTVLTTRSGLEGKVGYISQPFLFRTGFLFCTLIFTSSDRSFRTVLCALHLLQDVKKKPCFSLVVMLYRQINIATSKTTAEMSSDVSTALNIGIVVLWVMTPC